MRTQRNSVGLALIGALLCLCLLTACGQGGAGNGTASSEPTDTAPHGADFYNTLEDLSPYVVPGPYTGLTVTPQAGETRQDAVWRAVREQAQILAVPEGEIAYYYRSLTAQHRYYASLKDLTYEEVLASLGLTEEALLAEARRLAEEDLIYYAVLRDSGLSLTEEERDPNGAAYAAYVAMFSSAPYSYSEEYVRAQMDRQILDTMLHDKLSQFLLERNTVTEA